MCRCWLSFLCVFVCLCRRLSPKTLLSWPTSGNARGQSACGGRLRQTLVWPLRWVGARAFPRSRPSGFFAGKAGGDTFTNPTLRRLVRAARCRLGAVAGGASRAICVPRQSVPSCRRARPCGLAPRLGLHPPSAAPSPPPSLRSLRRLRYPPCGSGARVQIRPLRGMTSARQMRTHRISKRQGAGCNLRQPAILSDKTEWLRRGGRAQAEAQRLRMASEVRGEVRSLAPDRPGRARGADCPECAASHCRKPTPSG